MYANVALLLILLYTSLFASNFFNENCLINAIHFLNNVTFIKIVIELNWLALTFFICLKLDYLNMYRRIRK